jgi:hypothetical protein
MQWRALGLGVVLTLAVSGRTSAAQATNSMFGALVGSVLTDRTDKPIFDAEIELTDIGLKAKTDSAGNFEIKDVPAGVHPIVIRALNFDMLQNTLTFHAGETLSRDFLLRPVAEMRLRIKGSAETSTDGGRLAEFEARRKMGSGRFITREVFEESNGRRQFAELLMNKISGVVLVSNSGERSLATGNRGSISFANTPGGGDRTQKKCYVQVIIDNVVRYRSSPGEKLFNIDTIDPNTVAAVEFYTVSQTPLQFNSTGAAPCGTLVIWTRTS